MKPKRDDSLSDLARQLLVAERSVVEAEPLKGRALARAREAVETGRLSRAGLRASLGGRAWRTIRSAPRVAVSAAALVIAGMAAAAAGILIAPSPEERPRPAIVAPPSPKPVPLPAAESPAPRAAPLSPLPRAPVASLRLPAASSSAPRGAATTKRSETASRSGSARQYALELELLEPARQAIARSNYGAALEAAARHEQSFPSGQLAEERSALRVRALWASGRRAEARAEAERFGKRYPRSGLLAWMRAASAPPP